MWNWAADEIIIRLYDTMLTNPSRGLLFSVILQLHRLIVYSCSDGCKIYWQRRLGEGNKTLPIRFKYLYNSAVVRETSASHPNIWDLLGHVCGKLKRLSGILEYKYGHVCPILGDFYIMCTIHSSVSIELVRHFSFLSNAKTACLLSY